MLNVLKVISSIFIKLFQKVNAIAEDEPHLKRLEKQKVEEILLEYEQKIDSE